MWISPDTPLPPHPLLSPVAGQHINQFLYCPLHVTVLIPTHKRPHSLNMALGALVPQMQWIKHIIIAPNPLKDADDCTNGLTRDLLATLEYGGATTETMPVDDYAEALLYAEYAAKTEVVLVLDDDMVLGKNYLDMSAHFRYPKVGVVSGTIQAPVNYGYREWSRDPITPNWKGEPICNRLRVEDGKLTIYDKWQVYMISQGRFYWFMEFFLAGAFMIRRDLLALVDDGMLRFTADGHFIFTGWELDLSFSIRERGHHLIYDATRIAYHLRAKTGRNRGWPIEEGLKNWNYMLRKHGYDRIDAYPGVMEEKRGGY